MSLSYTPRAQVEQEVGLSLWAFDWESQSQDSLQRERDWTSGPPLGAGIREVCGWKDEAASIEEVEGRRDKVSTQSEGTAWNQLQKTTRQKKTNKQTQKEAEKRKEETQAPRSFR